MKIDGSLIGDLADVPERVRHLEDMGYDGAVSVETTHDPFLPLALAAEHSSRVELLTNVAIALARSPMTVAYTAYDIQVFSGGRLRLGLGSQIRPHIEKRFGMPWSGPAARMREFILALRAIWTSWETGERLNFRGDHYTHTLMTPFFAPKPSPFGPPRVYLGALGELMSGVAGEVCDGVFVHPMTTERYIRECSMPAIERGLAKSGRDRAGFEIGISPFVVTGVDEEAIERSRTAAQQQIAFYGSTPAYRVVLELHGWGEVQDELNMLSKRGRWAEMAEQITPEMLAAFTVEAPLDRIADALRQRYGDIADRMSFYPTLSLEPDHLRSLIATLKS
jgi:probable F420-dependent oxidoreductase